MFNNEFTELMNNFQGTHKELLVHDHFHFQKKINSTDKKLTKNKYIQMRNAVLNYVINNKHEVMRSVCKSNIKK